MNPPMAPDLTCLKSEMTATTVITPTIAKYRRWHRHLHLAPIRRVVPLTSARPNTAGGTQDLVTAAQAAMNEAIDRFASYADSGVPAFGGECAAWWVRSIQWRASPTGGGGETHCTSCKTTIIPLWRRDPQSQPLCNAYGSFFVSVPTNVGSRIIVTSVF